MTKSGNNIEGKTEGERKEPSGKKIGKISRQRKGTLKMGERGRGKEEEKK